MSLVETKALRSQNQEDNNNYQLVNFYASNPNPKITGEKGSKRAVTKSEHTIDIIVQNFQITIIKVSHFI